MNDDDDTIDFDTLADLADYRRDLRMERGADYNDDGRL